MKTACIHITCSVCSIGLPQHLLKIQLHCSRECLKRNWRFILPCGSRLMGHYMLNLAIFVVSAPRRKTFWFRQKWDSLSLWLRDIKWSSCIFYNIQTGEYDTWFLINKYGKFLFCTQFRAYFWSGRPAQRCQREKMWMNLGMKWFFRPIWCDNYDLLINK